MLLWTPRQKLFLERLEEQTAGFTDWIQAAVDAHSVHLLATAAVDLQDLEARSDVPDVDEGDLCELHSPLHGDADAAEESVDHVAQVLAAVEALVGVGPHAVHGMSSFWFRQHIFESDLKYTKGCMCFEQGFDDYSEGKCCRAAGAVLECVQ